MALSLSSPIHGEVAFKRFCSVCHAVEKEVNMMGPSLAGVVGRKAGTAPHFQYTDENINSGITWTPEALDRYLTDPQKVIPGTSMTFPGIKDAEVRKQIIDYLSQHSK